ncbi:uncharacterized protein involved in tellurium resistance [Clostridium saccharoperbutylacetonicum]|uniref:DUF1659 domain-containing protein n=1 Tax=Clostridium saccharoperbutylacetonicum N1-4(HMT) TaxID=931276 RepID=M1MYU2_9CLOT|nr:DUF1659 domain-containing protein [Clostridium saccharoperbutylacetonicum]AGF59666.1 hypothetical protein DUF1659 [Clostridium saccharoperbutylacetonicum N1-4(HMT)]NRT64584.1 uncharacterized protein involved in tellurium resistance [Clostridium saccharoperbutylacetonicum]NSB28952.1 uncharacterized protein involved in tellurium resistance [Clostridium saccharoperbutylacetonicum]NSB46166.1 uncharacterized protein involved in tellurium resistance [Clostridium saccharoperbutylacetonicum]
MAVSLTKKATSLGIEVQKGVDKAGDAIFKTKMFANVKNDADPSAVYEVSQAIKGVMADKTRDTFLSVTSSIDNN